MTCDEQAVFSALKELRGAEIADIQIQMIRERGEFKPDRRLKKGDDDHAG